MGTKMSQIDNLLKSENQTIKCKSCGATISIHEKYCTFCGEVNEFGDELDYQKKLEDICDDMEQLDDDSARTYKNEIKKGARNTIKLAIFAAIIVMIGLVAVLTVKAVKSRMEEIAVKEAREWERETFAKLDELYEQEEYDEIINIYNDYYLEDKPDKHNIGLWSHNEFMRAYRAYDNVRVCVDGLENVSEIRTDDVGYAFEECMVLTMTDWKVADRKRSLTERDFERIKEYQDYGWQILEEHFDLSFVDVDNMYQELFDLDTTLVEPDVEKCFNKGKTLTWK